MTLFLKQLIAPTGLIWVLLTVLLIVTLRRKDRRVAGLTAATWLALTILGNGFLVSTLVVAWTPDEAKRSHVDLDEPLDAVVVLGGCAAALPSGDVCLTESGDRIAVATRLYHAGQTRRVVAAGGAAEDPLAPMHVGAQILTEFGIPSENVLKVSGFNTSAELAAFQSMAADNGWTRVGVSTDSWHMRRVLVWAEGHDFDFLPLPAGGASEQPTFEFQNHIIPSAGALRTSRLLILEFVGSTLTAVGLR